MITLITVLILSYLVGSIPSSIIAGKFLKGIDIRDYGSGNAGGTNAFRVLGWKAGLIVSLFDIGKGTFATLVISQLMIDPLVFSSLTLIKILAGLAAILGHTFTVFGGFRGGKGVATGAGMIIGLFPVAFLICLSVFALILFSTGLVSLSSIIASVSLPVTLFIFNSAFSKNVDISLTIFSIIIPFFIIFTHRANIKRLLAGEEKAFSNLILFKKK